MHALKPSERFASVVTVLVSVAFAAAACWELGGPLGSGHVAAQAAVALAAENMVRWGTFAPVTHVLLTAPTPADWYCHHPFGIFWWQVPFTAVLGHSDFALRLPAVVLSAATPPVLYAVGRRLWNPVSGMVCAVSFAVVPLALAFSSFNALEVPVIFFVSLSALGTVGFAQTLSVRWLVISVVAQGLALNADWSAWFFVVPVLVVSARWAWRAKGRVRTWWVASAAVLLGIGLFYFVLFSATGQLTQLLDSGRLRSSGNLSLDARRYWLELSFTRPGLALSALGLPLIIARAVTTKRALELLPLAVGVMALTQYLAFPNGADTHIFWPQLFAPWFALSMGALAASLPVRGGVIVGLVVAAMMLPDAVRALEVGRRTGLRFDERGRFIEPDLDKEAMVRWLAPQVDQGVFVHTSFRSTQAIEWALGHATRVTAELSPVADEHFKYLLADRRWLGGDELAQIARVHAVRAVGPYLVVDLSSAPAPAQGFSFERREPTFTERLWRSAHTPVMQVVPDVYATWELRQLLDEVPPSAPTEAPKSFAATLTAVNAALANADPAAANRWLNALSPRLNRDMARKADGVELLGVAVEPGVAPLMHVVFRAEGPLTPDAWYFVRAVPLSTPAWSMVGLSERARLVSARFQVPTSRWRPGFVYETVVELAPGVGRERYVGSFNPSDSQVLEQGVTLFEVEGK